MDIKKFRIPAAIVCFSYILVQSFQWWVFSQVPNGADAVKNLLNGGHILNIWRSSLMLFSMFGLWFIYSIICLENYKTQKIYSLLAFISFSIFCFLEICLRSTELFYIQIYLPEHYQTLIDIESKHFTENIVKVFYQVQTALYFPLGLGWMLGSFLIAKTSKRWRENILLKLSFSINAIRIFLRISTVYFGFNILADNIYSAIYLPLVIITFGLLGLWFSKPNIFSNKIANI